MKPEEKINKLRKDIDELDKKIVDLLNKRAEIVLEIIKTKNENQISLYDPRREQEIFESLRKANKGPLYDEAVLEIYETILHWMKSLETEE